MKNLVAHELRRLHRKNAQLDRRLANVDLTGKVKPGSQDMEKRTVRLVLGKSADGREVLSAPVRWEGTGAGEFKMHATPKDGEQMVLHSASGTVGATSLARWGTFDKDNAPPSKSKDEVVLEFGGKARITFGKSSLKLGFGDSSGLEVEAEEIKTLSRLRIKGGSRQAHFVGGKDSGNDTAVEGSENLLI